MPTVEISMNDSKQNSTFWRSIYPWVVWALASSFLFYKYLLQVSPSVMVNDLMRDFHLTGAEMGNLAAFYFYAYLSMQLPVGLLLDRFSPRRLVTAAIVMCASGALLFAVAQQLGLAYLGRLLIGLGGAFSAVGTMKLITLWFPPRKFALVSGLMMTVGMLGAVGGEAPLAATVEWLGWRNTMLAAAGVGLVLALVIYLFVRDRSHPIMKNHGQPRPSFWQALRGIISRPQSWLISIYSGLAFAPISAFAGLWGVPYLMENYRMPRTDIAALVSLVFIGFAIGSPLAGWFSDKIQRRKPIMALGTGFGLLGLVTILYLPGLPHLLLALLLFLFGFFTSFFFVSFAVMREINNPLASGTAIGFINMFNAMCGAFSEPLIGKLLDLKWDHKILHGVRIFSITDYHWALFTLPILMLIALFLLLFIEETKCETAVN
jgi:MFS family permease